MSRRRIRPPLGLPESPNYITCEKRMAEAQADFLRRLEYALESFRHGFQFVDFNESLARLKLTVRRGPQSSGRGNRVHPILELTINHRARMAAAERTGDENAPLIQDDVGKAAAWVTKNMSPVRGRPRAQLLDHHVAGLMALIQQFTGTAVLASRHTGPAQYEPRLLGAARYLLRLREIDTTITETQLVNKVCQIRREYAGRLMRFRDFYPFYGAKQDCNGDPALAPPFRLQSFERSIPIYCP